MTAQFIQTLFTGYYNVLSGIVASNLGSILLVCAGIFALNLLVLYFCRIFLKW